MKTIKFKNDWRYSREGDVIEEGDGVAELLILRGIAEEVEPKEVAGGEEVEPTQGGDDALPQIITRQVPGPIEGRPRRGGRG